jgi:hypothetical protein
VEALVAQSGGDVSELATLVLQALMDRVEDAKAAKVKDTGAMHIKRK